MTPAIFVIHFLWGVVAGAIGLHRDWNLFQTVSLAVGGSIVLSLAGL